MNDLHFKHAIQLALSAFLMLIAAPVLADDVRITTLKEDSTFTLNDRSFTISRIQDTTNALTGPFTLTSRVCPPNCLQPMTIAAGVVTLGELEVLTFLETDVAGRKGLLLDSRLPEDFATGSIPSAVNVPYATLIAENPYRSDILRALGAVALSDGRLDFANSMSLALFGGGVWSNDAPMAISHLLAAGYPPEKLFYYRGGMQAWVQVGLTVQVPQTPG